MAIVRNAYFYCLTLLGDILPSSSALPSEIVPPSENSENAPQMVIWGTNVQLNDCKRKFKK